MEEEDELASETPLEEIKKKRNEIPMEEIKKKLSQVLSDGGHNLKLEEDILFLRRNVDTGSDVDNPGQHVVFKDGSMVSRHLLKESLSKIYVRKL